MSKSKINLFISKESKINPETLRKEIKYYVMADHTCQLATEDEEKAKKFYEAYKQMIESGPLNEIILHTTIEPK